MTIAGTQTFDFTDPQLLPTGRCIFIPDRNKRNIYQPEIRKAVSENCKYGIALVGNPVDGSFKNMNGEAMLSGSGNSAIVDILLANTSTTATFENIDGVNTTNPGLAVAVYQEPGGSPGLGTFYDLGNILGTYSTEHFVSSARSEPDIFVGPFDPRGFTQTAAMTAANFAFLMPFSVSLAHTVSGARTYIATQSGNICVGIYDSAGIRRATTFTIACPATGEQTVTFDEPMTLNPGVTYYLAMAANNTTMAMAHRNSLIYSSGYVDITALPLPATISIPGNPALENWMWVLTE